MMFLPGIGTVRVLIDIPEGADLRSFQLVETTKKTTRRTHPQDSMYRLHVQIRADDSEPAKSGVVRGVDLGVTHAAVTADSTGAVSYHDIPKGCKRTPNDGIDALRSRRSKRKRNSRGWRETTRRMSTKWEKIRNRQTNTERHIAKAITDGVGTVVLEDIRVSNMTRYGGRRKSGLNRSMGYARPTALHARTEQTAENGGVKVIVVSARNTSITCSACGHLDRNSRRTQSEFVCVSCGHAENADANAARNILSLEETRRQGRPSKDARAQAGFAPSRPSVSEEAVQEPSTGGVCQSVRKRQGVADTVPSKGRRCAFMRIIPQDIIMPCRNMDRGSPAGKRRPSKVLPLPRGLRRH